MGLNCAKLLTGQLHSKVIFKGIKRGLISIIFNDFPC